ncbi:HalOD1 output domain-containing protein [Salinigranum sp.]|uniref:HalOD1 output domain-containing protein n=1 Tax=Salinigranum sp. TaxID=1966351 RepID=UPI003563C6CA
MNTTGTAHVRQDDTVLVTRSFTDEQPSKSILHAFAELDVDLFGTEELLADVVDPDALDELLRTADGRIRASMVLWDHPVVVTSDVVRVFDPATDGE